MVLFSASVIAQNLHLTFTGTGESTIVDSVTATNLYTNKSITIPGNETLVLELSTGINALEVPSPNIGLFPNPFLNSSRLTYNQSEPGIVQITVQNLVGQGVYQSYQFLESGQHTFTLSLNKPGIYMVNINDDTGRKSIKAICIESNIGTVGAVHSGAVYPRIGIPNDNKEKSQQARYSLAYAIGDIIHYKGISGKYIAILTDSPEVSKNYEIEFVDCTDQDGNYYSVVKIGSQMWMAENLAYLPAVSPSSRKADTYPFYYVYGNEGSNVNEAKATDYYETYGVLYNWEAAKTACPSGWHLPTDDEWKILENYLGMQVTELNVMFYRGSGDVDKKLKSTTGWHDNSGDNSNGDNSSGFNALPSGRIGSNGGFDDLGYFTSFWSSSEIGTFSLDRYLFYSQDGVGRYYTSRRHGESVRCLKN